MEMNILVLCEDNAVRSQMAQTVLRRLAPKAKVNSAGTAPASVLHPYTVRAAYEQGYSMMGQAPKSVEEFKDQRFDFVLTLCDNAREGLPPWLSTVPGAHVSQPRPPMAGGLEQFSETFE